MKTNIKEIRKLVRSTIKMINSNHGYKYKAVEESLRAGYQMEADAKNDAVVFDPKNIRDSFNDPRFLGRTNIEKIENFITVLICHEIGHLLDYKKNSFLFYNKGFEEQMELNAWELGLQVLPPELINDYNGFKEWSLDSYRQDGKF